MVDFSPGLFRDPIIVDVVKHHSYRLLAIGKGSGENTNRAKVVAPLLGASQLNVRFNFVCEFTNYEPSPNTL